MSQKYFGHPIPWEECLNYSSHSNVQQNILSFASDITVTLRNPQRVINNTGTASNIAIQMRYDTAPVVRYFPAGGQLFCDPVMIGSSARGTTCTNVVIDGVD